MAFEVQSTTDELTKDAGRLYRGYASIIDVDVPDAVNPLITDVIGNLCPVDPFRLAPARRDNLFHCHADPRIATPFTICGSFGLSNCGIDRRSLALKLQRSLSGRFQR
jgi:hypothetical protein